MYMFYQYLELFRIVSCAFLATITLESKYFKYLHLKLVIVNCIGTEVSAWPPGLPCKGLFCVTAKHHSEGGPVRKYLTVLQYSSSLEIQMHVRGTGFVS